MMIIFHSCHLGKNQQKKAKKKNKKKYGGHDSLHATCVSQVLSDFPNYAETFSPEDPDTS